MCSAVAYVLYFRLIADIGPTRAMTVTFLMPALGLVWGALFLDETVTPGDGGGRGADRRRQRGRVAGGGAAFGRKQGVAPGRSLTCRAADAGLAGRAKSAIVGAMDLDPEIARYLERISQAIPVPAVLDADARRARMEAIQRRFPPTPDTVSREDAFITLPGRELFVRIFRPGEGIRPALVFFHGGGWVAGSVLTHDGIGAALARDADVVVVSVAYRRAPENPFPLPNDDAYAALAWVAANASTLGVDAARLAVGGDSAGAHLAAGVAIEARERGPTLAFQLLVYPVIEPDFESPSYLEHANSPTLTRADMIAYWRHYAPEAATTTDARAVPSRAASHAGLPPAHVVVASLDPLRDDGLRYAQRLRDAGVATTVAEAARLPHGFLRAAPYSSAARAAQQALGAAAGRALRGAG